MVLSLSPILKTQCKALALRLSSGFEDILRVQDLVLGEEDPESDRGAS